jgi:hypothetical protein
MRMTFPSGSPIPRVAAMPSFTSGVPFVLTTEYPRRCTHDSVVPAKFLGKRHSVRTASCNEAQLVEAIVRAYA